jgi:drug/metabolite transporter (DMT)-like permease
VNKNRRRAYLALFLNALIWGIAPPLVKLTLIHTTPFRWLFYRYLFAAPLSLPLLIFLLHRFPLKLKQVLQIIVLELLGTTIVLSLIYEGLKRTTATETALIIAVAPVFVTLGGLLFLKEKEEKHEWLGLIIALAGTLAITLEPLIRGTNHISLSLVGNTILLIHNFAWAAYLILAKKIYKKLSKLLVTSISFWVGLVSFGLLSLFTSTQPLLTDLSIPLVTFSSLYMATFGSIVALTLYLYGQNLIEASEAAMFNYLHPAISIPLAVWWLGESINPTIILGIILIAAGVFLCEIRIKHFKPG